jgi:TolB-like protein
MNYFKFLFALAVLAANTAQAAKILAVLELVSASDEIDLSISETRHLTDELRGQAVQTLPSKDYTVLTRDNIFSLIPSDEKEATRLANSSAVEIGKAMGAEYVSQGSIGSFGDLLTISIELYETKSGKLLGSIVIESKDVVGLLAMIREKSPGLFSKIRVSEPEFTEFKNVQNEEKGSTDTFKKSNTSFFVAIGLDVLGAAMLGYGIYQHINSNKLYDDYKKMPQDLDMDKYDKALKKANDAQRQRNIGYTIGSTLLATGIAVHIWF